MFCEGCSKIDLAFALQMEKEKGGNWILLEVRLKIYFERR